MNAVKGKERRGLTPSKAAVILVAAIVAVGTVGYVVLNAIGPGHTTTTSSCAPAKAPQCAGSAKASEGFTSVGGASVLRS